MGCVCKQLPSHCSEFCQFATGAIFLNLCLKCTICKWLQKQAVKESHSTGPVCNFICRDGASCHVTCRKNQMDESGWSHQPLHQHETDFSSKHHVVLGLDLWLHSCAPECVTGGGNASDSPVGGKQQQKKRRQIHRMPAAQPTAKLERFADKHQHENAF